MTEVVSSPAASAWGVPYYPRPAAVGDAYTAYCAYVQRRYRRLSAPLFAAAAGARIAGVERRALSVSLALAERPESTGADEDALAADAHELLWWLERNSFLVVTGQPGSGKTWLLSQLADDLSARLSGPVARALPDHLPIPLTLSGLVVDAVIEEAGEEESDDSVGGLDALIERWFTQVADETGVEREHLQPFLDQGRWVVLIDGFETLGTPEHRQRVWTWLAEHQVRQRGRGYYVVSARPRGLAGLPLGPRATVVHIRRSPGRTARAPG